jgi:hypothetical protein
MLQQYTNIHKNKVVFDTSLYIYVIDQPHEVPVSIPGSTAGIFLEGEDSRGDHGLG